MNNNNLLLKIAAISLFGISSVAFSMDKASESDKNRIYKLFKISDKDLKKETLQKDHDYNRFSFSKGTDGKERFFVTTYPIDEYNKYPALVTKFKFSKNGKYMFVHYKNETDSDAHVYDMDSFSFCRIGEALPANESSDFYGFLGIGKDDNYVFIAYPSKGIFKIVEVKTGKVIKEEKSDKTILDEKTVKRMVEEFKKENKNCKVM